MAIGKSLEKQTQAAKQATSEAAVAHETTSEEAFSAFFFLRDLLSAADSSTVSLTMLYKLLQLDSLPEEISQVLHLIPETDQISAEIPELLDKMELLKATAEGAMQSVAALDMAKRAHEVISESE